MYDYPRLDLSVPPSAFRLTSDYDLGEAFGDRYAGMVAALVVVISQASEGDRRIALPLSFLPKGVGILAQQSEGPGAGILAMMNSREIHDRAFALRNRGLVQLETVGEGDGAYVVVKPTEEFLEPKLIEEYEVAATGDFGM